MCQIYYPTTYGPRGYTAKKSMLVLTFKANLFQHFLNNT